MSVPFLVIEQGNPVELREFQEFDNMALASNMNWYKKAQLQETLPYFQEFEELGEYVPNEEKLNSQLSDLGISLIKDIGQGDNGVAYLLSNGDVLKITTHSQEGQIAEYLMANPNPAIVNYKNVWTDGDLYYIIMERVDNVATDIPALNDIFSKLRDIIDAHHCSDVGLAYEILTKDPYFNSLTLSVKTIIMQYLQHLKGVPFPIFDFLVPKNMGIIKGRIKFFDIT